MTTDRMKSAVKFCEDWDSPKFTGNINNFQEVSDYLDEHLNAAKNLAREVYCDWAAEYGY